MGIGSKVQPLPVSPEFSSTKVGDVEGGSYFEVEPDGTIVYHGDATAWDDLVGSLVARQLTSVVGTLQYNWDNSSITMQPGGTIDDQNDRLIFNFQYPHHAITDGLMKLHIHWEQASTDQIEWTIQYRIQNNLGAKTEAWTTCTANPTNDSIAAYPGSGS